MSVTSPACFITLNLINENNSPIKKVGFTLSVSFKLDLIPYLSMYLGPHS